MALDDAAEPVNLMSNSSKVIGGRTKGDDPNNFANENVMAKSNLRQPKSFNFGFPDSGSSDEEEENAGPKQENV